MNINTNTSEAERHFFQSASVFPVYQQIPSDSADSGYGTAASSSRFDEFISTGDFTDTVVTDGYQYFILSQERYLLEVAFAREIFRKLDPLMLDKLASRREMATEQLYAFSVMLGRRASSVAQRRAASFIRRARDRIISHVREDLQPYDGDEQSTFLAEKMARWGINPTNGYSTRSSLHDVLQSELYGYLCEYEDEDDQPFDSFRYAHLRTFLLESDEFEELSHNLKLGLQAGEVDAWSNVRMQIAKELASLPRQLNGSVTEYTLAIDLPWAPKHFLSGQYMHLPEIPNLGSVITLSGAIRHIYATTVETYIGTTWPRYGPLILHAIQHALDSHDSADRIEMERSRIALCLGIESTKAYAVGHPLFVTSVAEVLAWLSTACRASSVPADIQTCRVRLRKAEENGVQLAFSGVLDIVRDVGDEDSLTAACWHGMFRNPVVAHNYPTPCRKSREMGLELSFNLMLALARTFWVTLYDGALLLKGFNTILTPTSKIDDSVTWHLTVNRGGDRLSYNAGIGTSCIRTTGDAIFEGARHFVGWTTSAKFLVALVELDRSPQCTCRWACLEYECSAMNEGLTTSLGTRLAEYDNINFSGGPPASAGLRAEAAVNFTAGKYLTLSSKISRGIKDTPEYLASDDYVQSMDAAARMSVVISDAATWQHWLADGASVVLHLCRAWLSKPQAGYVPEDSSIKLWSPEDNGSPSTSVATLTSVANRELELYVSHVKRVSKPSTNGRDLEVVVERQWFLLQDLAHRYFKWIEQIHDRTNKMRHSADFDLVRQGNKVIGFEFLDLLRGTSHVESCVLGLSAGAEAWLGYTRSKDTVHVLGSGFGELIKPKMATGETNVECGQQLTAPRHADYLIAPLFVLKEGMERLQHSSACAQVSRGVYWWNIDEAFQQCRCQRQRASSRCNLIVKKLHGKSLKEPSSQALTCLPEVFERYPIGAIIMGHEPQLLVKDVFTVDSFVPNSLGPGVLRQPPSSGARQHKRSPSDSGYASNAGNSSHDSQASSLLADGPSPEEFRIRGAASETFGKKLTKKRKTER